MYQLRCDRCGGALNQPATHPMQLVMTIKAGIGPHVPPLPEEQRRRCRGCGFVNVFLPLKSEDVIT